MKNKIQYSQLAFKDLDEIWNYITNELSNPLSAESIVNGIIDTIDGLGRFPEKGTKLIFDNGLDSGYCFIIYKSYMAFYHIQDELVYIDRIMYGKRDYINNLFPDME